MDNGQWTIGELPCGTFCLNAKDAKTAKVAKQKPIAAMFRVALLDL